MQWEFTYVSLWVEGADPSEVISERKARMAELGAEGWEPVGAIQFAFDSHTSMVVAPQVMFKRPIA